jgi:single-strand DNA-binding protein
MEGSHKHKNEVHLAGTLAKDPQVRRTTSGKAMATLTVTTRYKDRSEFHRVVCWELAAEKAAPLKKGDFVQVVGRLQTRSWEDKQTHQKKYSTEVIAWQFVTPGKELVTVSTTGVEVTDEDVPF